jgi:hypothetical protein
MLIWGNFVLIAVFWPVCLPSALFIQLRGRNFHLVSLIFATWKFLCSTHLDLLRTLQNKWRNHEMSFKAKFSETRFIFTFFKSLQWFKEKSLSTLYFVAHFLLKYATYVTKLSCVLSKRLRCKRRAKKHSLNRTFNRHVGYLFAQELSSRGNHTFPAQVASKLNVLLRTELLTKNSSRHFSWITLFKLGYVSENVNIWKSRTSFQKLRLFVFLNWKAALFQFFRILHGTILALKLKLK